MRYVIGIIVALALAAPAVAQDQGIYAGGSIGQMTAKDACDGFNGVPGVTCEDSDTAWRALIGYQFNRNFAAEVGYVNFGQVEARGPGGTATIEATAFEVVAIGMLPVADRFSIYGKAGIYRGETDANVNTFALVTSVSESNTDLTFGVGARFDFTRNIAGRVEWQRYTDVGGGDIGEADIDMISVGAIFKF